MQTDSKDELKDWKPSKIEKKKEEKVEKQEQKEDIAVAFLSSLSKPVNKSENRVRSIFDDEPALPLPKPAINMKKLTPEQIKWDIEDQTFIRK